ncbi:MAG: tRNA lysidine(34) synthetase TilS [SAR202 cluster bacterium Ae2-Chloro-G2]|nr:MAG: tRNA lysidine(34) synthetase TilS [SAR202 cluster bacterium Ae2-Chloro-G2]
MGTTKGNIVVVSVIKKFQDKVTDAVIASDLRDSKLVVAVSGGPDSMAMIHALQMTRSETGLNLIGAHLNHRLRGQEAHTDATYVKSVLQSLGIPCHTGNIDVKHHANKNKWSIEEAARNVRYQFLLEIVKQTGSAAAALGHNADDQAETILMHIIRGAGLRGLRGMSLHSNRNINGSTITIFRPLLNVSRTTIESYCSEANLQTRQDSTNYSPQYFRNSLRLQLTPEIKRFNPKATQAFSRLSKSVSRDFSLLEKLASSSLNDVAKISSNKVAIDLLLLDRLDVALQYRVLRLAVEKIKGTTEGISLNSIEKLISLTKGRTGSCVTITGRITAEKYYGHILIRLGFNNSNALEQAFEETMINLPGTTSVLGWNINATIDTTPNNFPHSHPGGFHTAWLNIPLSDPELTVRPRRTGDMFQPSGMGTHKKLKNFLIDSKIPYSHRNKIPMLIFNQKIAWIVGWRIAEWAKPMAGEQSWKLTFTKIGANHPLVKDLKPEPLP